MLLTRRDSLRLGAAGLAGFSLANLSPAAHAQGAAGDTYPTAAGDIVIHPVEHASLVIRTPGFAIHVDPVGGADLYDELPPAGLILVTHEHQDHFDAATLTAHSARP